jgi:hypothetical protein
LTFLRVVDKWSFQSQKQAALEMLQTRGSAAERIAAARLYDEVQGWLEPAFEELVETGKPPDDTVALLLGPKDLLRLWYMQTYYRLHPARMGSDKAKVDLRRYIRYLVLENGILGTFPSDINQVTF